MKFIFSLRLLVKYFFHSKINFISSRQRVISSLHYIVTLSQVWDDDSNSRKLFPQTILFTIDDDILDAMAHYDQTYELAEDEVDVLMYSGYFERPSTADRGESDSSVSFFLFFFFFFYKF